MRLLSETLEEEKAADAKLSQVAKKINVDAKAA
jgi:ferritin-like metal-binding protein YciE